MAEVKLLSTRTELQQSGSSLSIFTYFVKPEEEESPPFVIEAFVADDSGQIEGVPYLEGDLIIRFTDGKYPSDINLYIDQLGNLLVEANDASNYSINNSGDLLYTD